jgi:hypothetical protein
MEIWRWRIERLQEAAGVGRQLWRLGLSLER